MSLINPCKTCLVIIDVQPEYWTNCNDIRKDFPEFPNNCSKMISIARSLKYKIIWVRVDLKLISYLRALGIDTVLVSGLITSVCVQHSAFGLFEEGFRTIVITDACADRGRDRHNKTISLYGNYMYE